ncbi:MAG: hypothetical protein GF368_02545 [Candidatus Aenigmarchaeota archaeon]|nr:hypothetical protein [Candidatus Aenigmarchaeota archaeon]
MFTFDEKEFKEKKKRNFQERIWFIKYWVNYMKEHSNEEWSSQQADLINAQIRD